VRKLLIVFFISLITVACDKVINSEETKMEVFNGSVSGSKIGWCMECGLGIDGSYDCMPKLKYHCSCEQPAVLQKVHVKYTYESGDTKEFYRDDLIREYGECT